jgi:predicted O-methyltransferase YrrM
MTLKTQLPLFVSLERAIIYRLDRWLASWRRLAFKRQVRAWQLDGIGTIPTHTKEDELAALYQLACETPMNSTAIEIGSYLGASTCHIAAGLAQRNSRLICVDTWLNETMPEGPRDTFAEFQRNTMPVREILVPVRKRTNDLVQGDIPTGLALAFIDGDHSYEGVRCDVDAVTPHMADRSILVFHDSIYFIGVSKVIGELIQTGQWQLKGQVNSLVWLTKKGFEK